MADAEILWQTDVHVITASPGAMTALQIQVLLPVMVITGIQPDIPPIGQLHGNREIERECGSRHSVLGSGIENAVALFGKAETMVLETRIADIQRILME